MKELLHNPDIFMSILTAVATVVGLVWSLVKGALFSQGWFKKYRVNTALNALEMGIQHTWENYVREAKQSGLDGKLTDAERVAARAQATAYAINYAKENGVDLLRVWGKELLPVVISKLVSSRKSVVPLPLGELLPAPELG